MESHEQPERVHVSPIGDEREHCTDGEPCPCLPMERDGVVRHNAYDAREVGEVCRRALDMLGVQKPPPWTNDERDAYEHAIQLLDMHWPEPHETPAIGEGAYPFRPKQKDPPND